MSRTENARVTDVTAVAAEGVRIGFVSCQLCGAALMIDPRESQDSITMHMAWHDDRTGSAS